MKKILVLMLLLSSMTIFSQNYGVFKLSTTCKTIGFDFGEIVNKNYYMIDVAYPIFNHVGYFNVGYSYMITDNFYIGGLTGFYLKDIKTIKFNIGTEIGLTKNMLIGSIDITNNYIGVKLGIKIKEKPLLSWKIK